MAQSEINLKVVLKDKNPGAALLSDLTTQMECEFRTALRQVCYEHEIGLEGEVLLDDFTVTSTRRIY